MQNSNLFSDAARLLNIATSQMSTKKTRSSIFGSSNLTREANQFVEIADSILNNIREADRGEAVLYNDSDIPSWSTAYRANLGYYQIALYYMPCVGVQNGIIRLLRYKYNSNNQVVDKLAYMIVIREGNASVKKYTGWKVDDSNSTPDWDSTY